MSGLPTILWVVLLCLGALGAQAPGPVPAPPRPAIRLIELTGTPLERGLRHGRDLKPQIQALVALWRADLEKTYGMKSADFVTLFRQETRFEAAALKWTPELVEEIRGIAQGAEIDYDTMFVYQLVDEVWALGGEIVHRDKCTSVGLDRRGSAPTVVAQNLDIPKFYHGHQTILQITTAKAGNKKTVPARSLVVTVPGLVGMNGMNDAPLGVAVNTLLQLRPSREGLPVAFVVRGVLACRSFEQARKFLFDVRHASGQNYVLGGPVVAHSFECSANRVVRYQVRPPVDYVWHTNHPLVNTEWAPAYLARAKGEGKTGKQALPDCSRFATLAERFAGAPPDLGAILSVLRSRAGAVSVCNDHTFACTVMLLGGVPELRISIGPPDKSAMFTYRFPAR